MDLILGKSTLDAPPIIRSIRPADISNPGSFVQVANLSNTNTLSCEADNADNVTWQYSEDGIVAYSATAVPSHLNREGILQHLPNNRIRSVLDDRGTFGDIRKKINGFFRCIATNNQGKGYTAIVPPVRIIFVCKY